MRGGGTVCQQTDVSNVYSGLVGSVENCKKSQMSRMIISNEIEVNTIYIDED